MSATAKRRRPVAEPFEVLHLTQHWRRIGDRWYRDAVVLVGGERRLYALPEAA